MYQENNNSNRNSSNSIPTLDFGAFPSYKTKINKTLRNFTINTLKFHPNQQNDLNSENTRTTNSSKTLNKTLPSRNLFDFGLSPTKKSGISKRNLSRSGESKEIFKRNIFDINIMKISGFAHETIENLENSLKQIKCQNKEYQQMIENHLLNESKLKIYVQNLLEINGKLVVRLREKESVEEKNNSNFILQISKKNTLIDQNDYLNLNKENQKNIETLQKQTIEFNDERDYLQEKIENLNQKLEGLMKSYTYKEKMIDFYKNRLKLCQFKLENYPKSEKEQIKLLEDYIMDLLGENSKLNKALEKTDFESKKWQEKYFDFEKSKEILVPHNSNIEHNNKKRNNFIEDNKKVNNDRNQKEINKSGQKENSLFWVFNPK